MTSILRQIVAGPRARHPEAGLDLCYVTDFIVVTSGPSSAWPKKAYRNPTDQLVKFLDYKHDENWAIFEFRAEGTGYPDSEVYNRIHHFPWPDHHPPPFALIPNLMASMRNWLQGDGIQENQPANKLKRRVAVVHCKAGKGRSGTVACSYLISQEGWSRSKALKRFTERRMRAGFGEGVSIPSQLRYVRYVDEWTNKMNKQYVERPVEIVELHVLGLRDGVKVAVNSYIEEGRQIKCFHTFHREEKVIIDSSNLSGDTLQKMDTPSEIQEGVTSNDESYPSKAQSTFSFGSSWAVDISNVIFRPISPIVLPTSDIDIDFERRNNANYTGWTMVTSIAHVWFNAYFEGGYSGVDSGVFEIDWEAMDGIKGSVKKGIKALDKLKVVWRYLKEDGEALGKVITEPAKGEPVPEPEAADWKGGDGIDEIVEAESKEWDDVTSEQEGGALKMGASMAIGAELISKQLGLRKETPESTNISRANSIRGDGEGQAFPKNSELQEVDKEEEDGVRALGPDGEEQIVCDDGDQGDEIEGRADTTGAKDYEKSMAKMAHLISKMGRNNKHDPAKQSRFNM